MMANGVQQAIWVMKRRPQVLATAVWCWVKYRDQRAWVGSYRYIMKRLQPF
jgi:hypothetical protein